MKYSKDGKKDTPCSSLDIKYAQFKEGTGVILFHVSGYCVLSATIPVGMIFLEYVTSITDFAKVTTSRIGPTSEYFNHHV